MLEGLRAAASGMTAQQERLDQISGDVANVSTPGYKRSRTAFRDLVYTESGLPARAGIQTGSGAAASAAGRSMEQGTLQRTDRALDLAIEGPGFFQVRRADGSVGLTRAGAMTTDGQGRLGTTGGLLLEPAISLPAGATGNDVVVAPDGTVSALGRTIGAIRLVNVPAPGALAGGGDGTLLPTAASGAVRPAANARISAGTLEASNVDLASSMVEMIEAQRAFTLASRAVTTQDQLMEIANGIKR
jgi:flagellar basal-body rod protein FlgG